MFEKLLMPLVLANVLGGTLRGKTRCQKLVFLIQKQASTRKVLKEKFDYELSHYGPFSNELASVMDELVKKGYLWQETQIAPAGYLRYVYSLTKAGKELLDVATEKNLLAPELTDIIKDVAEGYGDLPLPQLVEEAKKRF